MARLLSPPVGLGTTSIEPLSGPRSVGGGTTTSVSNYQQTVASPFGLWRWRLSFPAMQGSLFRRYRGWISALHGGANATRWTFFDPDCMTFQEAGVNASQFEIATGKPWSNGQPWANKENWQSSRPVVSVASAASLNATIISLANQWWGHRLGVGDYVGFFPFHFGMYEITEVIEPGRYRIWPPLDKAIAATDFATLSPTLALRLESEEAASAGRGLVAAESLSATLVQVKDYDVRDYFAD
ncbi:hypothetical protein [Mesorhizobium retamae]|uniref:Uncharacterized protein n=1 Tax=Mesorhizobium retamae TaxID=2912854 RepID=A0ABS9QN50_9HYPH|nr:hypothetical protein [Mesorhizobium sp. IRAMC:0171]MCG7508867.1 hypothetical protein [Mesorhizobium sp. IRAMC:0171]